MHPNPNESTAAKKIKAGVSKRNKGFELRIECLGDGDAQREPRKVVAMCQRTIHLRSHSSNVLFSIGSSTPPRKPTRLQLIP